MPQVILRNFPDELLRVLKSKAALEGVTMTKYVIDLLAGSLGMDIKVVMPKRGKPPTKKSKAKGGKK